MATIDSPEAIARIIKFNGSEFPDEPPVVKIVQYQNAWGTVAYGVVFEGEDLFRYNVETEFVQKPKTIWVRK